jgi:DNA-binding winged helix-turn-helix (wHTH) protein
MRKRFETFVFDSEVRQLLREGRPVPLSPKAFALLELLLERAPRAISKEEIQDALWPATYVSESSLTNVVAEARAALGDSARNPRLLRTVHGFGYAFCGTAFDEGTVAEAGDFVPFRLVRGNRKIPLSAGENILGRDPDASVHVDHASVSRRHARISVRGSKVVLEDLASRNGTFLAGRRIDSPVELHDGDIIGLGPVTLTFQALTAPGSTASDLST